MKSSLFINTKPPYSSGSTKESLDAAMASAAFGVNVGLLFLGDGVFQLVSGQNPDANYQKRTAPIFNSLELYEISDVFVCEEDLMQRALTLDDLMIPAQSLPAIELHNLMNSYNNLLTF